MRWKTNSPTPSTSPATIPNQAEIERSEFSDAEFSAIPLCDLATGIVSAPREDEIILSQFSKAKIEVPNRIDLRMGTAASTLEQNAPSHAPASWLYFLLIAAGFFLRLRLAW